MKSSLAWAILTLCACTTYGVAQKEICVGAIGGSDALTWNIQQPLLKAIETEANSRGVQVTTRLLTNNNDKAAKGEMSALKCDSAVLTYVSREWPTPKASGGGGGGATLNAGGSKDDNPHPPSTAHFEYTLVDKSARKLDKFKTSISMEVGYTAKDVDPDVKQMIQEVANWTVDGAVTGGK